MWLFPEDDGSITALPRFWVPRDGARARSEKDHVPYLTWIAGNHLRVTEGDIIDYDVIRRDLNADADQFQLRQAGYDTWNATQLATQLQGDGFTMVPVRQGFATLSEPTKRLLAFVQGRKIRHDGHPVLAWMASNLVTAEDPAGNLKPDKAKATEKIDGIVALIIAISRWIVQEAPQETIIDRGILVLGSEEAPPPDASPSTSCGIAPGLDVW